MAPSSSRMQSSSASSAASNAETPRKSGSESFSSNSAAASRRPSSGFCAIPSLDALGNVPRRGSAQLYSERCRSAAKEEVVKASKAWALSSAAAKLREPLANLEGLEGLPPELIRRCAVTMRGQEALKLVPEILQQEWTDGALQKWTAHSMKNYLSDDSKSSLGKKKHAVSKKHGKSVGSPNAPSAEVHELDATKAAFELLEKWIGVLRPIAPCGQLQRCLISLVHGAEPQLPPEPVATELMKLVPKPGQLEDGESWKFLDELGACLDLEKQFVLSSVMHAEVPAEVRRHLKRPYSASAATRPAQDRAALGSASTGQLLMKFPQAFKDVGGGGMRITASSMRPWAAGSLPRSPRGVEVPGPGFYVDRSMQRSVSNPKNGEFASCGKLRTCCALNTVSVTSRFGEVDLSRPTSAASRRGLGRPASAPCLAHSTDSQWKKLLTV